jgi:hypothetical protein
MKANRGWRHCWPELTYVIVYSIPLLPFPAFLTTATPKALLESFRQTTPPGSIINGLPTPHPTADAKFSTRVAVILRVFNGCKTAKHLQYPGQCTSSIVGSMRACKFDWKTTWSSRDTLMIESGKWWTWLICFCRMLIVFCRYDYDPIGCKLIIRITTTLHDTFASDLVTEIK